MNKWIVAMLPPSKIQIHVIEADHADIHENGALSFVRDKAATEYDYVTFAAGQWAYYCVCTNPDMQTTLP
jgi:hypothetical protein